MLSVAVGLALAMAAPGQGSDDLSMGRRPPQPIVGGTDVELGRWDAVVSFVQGTRFCSGTVVAPRLVLTAAHCLIDLPPDAEFSVRFGVSAEAPSDIATVEKFGAFPDFCETCNKDRDDIGYLLLEQSVSLPGGFPELIVDQPTWYAVMIEGQPLTMVGFGQDQPGTPTPSNELGLGRKREVDTTLRYYSKSGLDFLAGSEQIDTCQGDSGGPAFIEFEGSILVAGVLSGGLGECGSGESVYSVPVSAIPWIRDETGIDLSNGTCTEDPCLDTSVEDEEGCGCTTKGPRGWGFVLVLLGLGLRRRRAGG